MPTDAGTTTTEEKPDPTKTADPPAAGTEPDKETGTDDDAKELTAADAAKWRELARKHERDRNKALAELDKVKAANMSEAEKAIEKAKQEGADEARAAMLGEMVNLAVDTAAAEKLSDPTFARLLDDDARAAFVTDGKVDRTAIGRALDDLVKRHPNLKKEKAGALPGGGKPAATGFSMNDEIRRAAGRGR